MIFWAWLITILSFIASIANIYQKRWSFALWFATNVYLLIHNLVAHDFPQAAIWAGYALLSAWGFVKWGNPNKTTKQNTEKR
jgi:nicotinamide riboside transporter PnuC